MSALTLFLVVFLASTSGGIVGGLVVFAWRGRDVAVSHRGVPIVDDELVDAVARDWAGRRGVPQATDLIRRKLHLAAQLFGSRERRR